MHRFAFPLCFFFVSSPFTTQSIIGVAGVTNGNSLKIREGRIRLHGINALKSRQLFARLPGKAWRCDQRAALELSDRVGTWSVNCESRDTERYGCTIAACSQEGLDSKAWMVREGWAVTYQQCSRDYVPAEPKARRAGRNIWSGAFGIPWDWRRGAVSP